ncbi:BLUF domain-containing protein [Hymenobacter bucti]|uniref:BLUF domain-containing protein n=1 Tax=Hymenobacter bucti TaxID=1844114 RepID=A0ABW4QSJ4_9BACT
MQVLEGPRGEVAAICQKIAHDERHKHAFVLPEGTAASRTPDWRTGFVAAGT